VDTVSEARAKRREAAARTGREYLEAVGVLPQDEEATGEEALDGTPPAPPPPPPLVLSGHAASLTPY
jgi:hypothetical protein